VALYLSIKYSPIRPSLHTFNVQQSSVCCLFHISLAALASKFSLKTSPQYFNFVDLFSNLYDWHFGSHGRQFLTQNFKSILFSQILKNPKMPMPRCQNAKPPISTITSPPYNSISLSLSLSLKLNLYILLVVLLL
jgi:hypothetical protein